MRRLVEEVAQLLEPQAAGKGIEMIVDVNCGTPSRLIGDKLRIRQILMNLMGNAVKFTQKGYVRVLVEPEVPSEDRSGASSGACGLHFVVEDTGIGITEEFQRKLFQPFHQADGGISRRFGGTGLGLVISRRLSELMGGRMWVRSVPGKGTAIH